jgi:hypothetical protein
VLAPAELVQAAKSAAPDAAITDHSEQAEVPLPQEPGKGLRHGWDDLPQIEVAFGDVVVTFTHDRLDSSNPRWQAVCADDGQVVAHQVVHGAGGVAQVLQEARALAGLPEPARPPQPSKLSMGGTP